MKLRVSCGVCNVQMAEVSKPAILPEDLTYYETAVTCNDHGAEDIRIVIVDDTSTLTATEQ